jgi:hypothetical protein
LVDLEQAYQRVREQGRRDPEQLKEALVEAAAQRNYIPGPAREAYARALLLDYRLWSGEIDPQQAPEAAGSSRPGCLARDAQGAGNSQT